MEKILIIIDAQNDLCTSGGSLLCENAETAVKNIIKVLNENPVNFDKVICSLDIHDKNYLNTMEGKYLPIEHCIRNTNGQFLNKEIYNALYRYDWWTSEKNSFMLDLNDFIEKDKYYEAEVYICGFATDICVLNNVLLYKKVFGQNNKICLIEDCCAGTSKEMHDMAVKLLRQNQIEIIKSYSM